MTEAAVPTVSQVVGAPGGAGWNIDIESIAPIAEKIAQGVRDAAGTMDSTIDGMNWSGQGRQGADYRSDRERQQMRLLADEFDTLADECRTHHANLASMVSTAKTTVNALRSTGNDGGGNYLVAENWTVTDNNNYQAAFDAAGDNQDLIDQIKQVQSDRKTEAENQTVTLQRLAADIGTEDAATATAIGSVLNAIDQLAPAPSTDGLTPSAAEEDGKAVADGSATPEEIARISARLGEMNLTSEQLQALERGETVDLPPGELAYLQSFYGYTGKDGLLALEEQLRSDPSPEAATLRDNLANGIMLVTNEDVVTRGPDGTVLSQGSYANLPTDLRQLVSGRIEENTSDDGYGTPQQVRDRFNEQVQFAELLGEANPGYTPGTEFGIELGRQGASIANYLNNVDENMGGNLPSAFYDSDRDSMERAAGQYLDGAARNHESAYALMTGNGVGADLSHGALGEEYTPQEFKADEFGQQVFLRDWQDDGVAAGGLYDWTGEYSHDPGPTGDQARQVLASLPDMFAPTDNNGTLLMDDGRPITDNAKDGTTTFNSTSEAFAENPALATALAKALAPNVDTFHLPGMVGEEFVQTGVNGDQLSFAPEDGSRMLFLANMSDEGSLYLETARQLNQADVLDRITQGNDPSPLETAKYLANIDAHMGTAAQNAKIYQDSLEVDGHNQHVQDQYETRQKAGEIVTGLIGHGTDAALERAPGGPIVEGIIGDLRDAGLEKALETWNPEPELHGVKYPDQYVDNSIADSTFKRELEQANVQNGSILPQGMLEDYQRDYSGAYNDTVDTRLVDNPNKLRWWLTGYVDVPK